MRVVFTKRAGGDHEILVTDRVAGPDIRHPRAETPSPMPHDLAHLAIEAALAIDDGFWGAIAAGATFGGFVPVDPRRHRTSGTKELRRRGAGIGAAERVVSYTYRVWCDRSLDPRLVGSAGPPIDGRRLGVALAALDDAGVEWVALGEDQALTRSW